MSSDLKSTTISIGEGSILGWTDMRSSMRSPNSGGRGSLGELTFKFHNNFIWKGGVDILAWSYPMFLSYP